MCSRSPAAMVNTLASSRCLRAWISSSSTIGDLRQWSPVCRALVDKLLSFAPSEQKLRRRLAAPKYGCSVALSYRDPRHAAKPVATPPWCLSQSGHAAGAKVGATSNGYRCDIGTYL